jgi:hypothetical protein
MAELITGDLEDRIEISADDYYIDENGTYNFDPEKLKESHEWCRGEVQQFMADEYPVIVTHNTFTRKWEVDPYIGMATKYEYQVTVLNIFDGGLSDYDLSNRGEHNTPPYVIQKQRKRWENDVYYERPKEYHNNRSFNQRKAYPNQRPKW